MTKYKRSLIFINILIFMATTLICCNWGHKNPDITNIDVQINIRRFEQDLFSIPLENIEDHLPEIRSKYPVFFELFNDRIIYVGRSNTPTYPDMLREFLTNYEVYMAYKRAEEIYSDFSYFKNKLNDAFKYYKYYFPDKRIPDILTFVSGFRKSIVVDDSLLAIGLDNYLGSDCEFYERLGISNYIAKNMNKDKIIPDCMSSWIKTEFVYNDSLDNILSNMIYQGMILYATSKVLLFEPDSLIIGFTSDHIKFCERYEKKMWTYLVEYNVLFKSDKLTINKFINDGPFTSDFTRESPARAATWIGWQIVKNYMKRNDITLYELMQEKNYMNIYNRALYAP